MIKEQFIE